MTAISVEDFWFGEVTGQAEHIAGYGWVTWGLCPLVPLPVALHFDFEE